MSKFWIVGKLEWSENRTAQVTIADSKTGARQCAERILARAQFKWAERKAQAEKSYERCKGSKTNLGTSIPKDYDKYAEWAAKNGGVGGVPWRDYLKLRDGIPVICPDGTRFVVKEPSKKALAEQQKRERKNNAFMKAVVGQLESRYRRKA